jgi:hypothetical protein
LIFSEVLADESITCLQKALTHLREIWELIGIPEEQRLQRTEVVKKHIKVSRFLLVSAVRTVGMLFEIKGRLTFGGIWGSGRGWLSR